MSDDSNIGTSIVKEISNSNIDDTCIICCKKVKIYAVQCKCKQLLCKFHVRETNHNCSFDYKQHGKDVLQQTNPKVSAEKLIKC